MSKLQDKDYIKKRGEELDALRWAAFNRPPILYILVKWWYQDWDDEDKEIFIRWFERYIKTFTLLFENCLFIRMTIKWCRIKDKRISYALLHRIMTDKYLTEHIRGFNEIKKTGRVKLFDDSIPDVADMSNKAELCKALIECAQGDDEIIRKLKGVLLIDLRYAVLRCRYEMSRYSMPLRELLPCLMSIDFDKALEFAYPYFQFGFWTRPNPKADPQDPSAFPDDGLVTGESEKYIKTRIVYHWFSRDGFIPLNLSPLIWLVREEEIPLVEETLQRRRLVFTIRYKLRSEEKEMRRRLLEKFKRLRMKTKRILMALFEIATLKWQFIPKRILNLCLVPYSYQKEQAREILYEVADCLEIKGYEPPPIHSWSEAEYEYLKRWFTRNIFGIGERLLQKVIMGRDLEETINYYLEKNRKKDVWEGQILPMYKREYH